jgi:hypothetical protein
MALFIQDPGDKYDNPPYNYPGMKWDFSEDDIPVYIDKYPYKAYSSKHAKILVDLRKDITKLCTQLEINRNRWENSTNNRQYLDGVDLFLSIHDEYFYDPYELPEPFHSIAIQGMKTSRYLLSEIPDGTNFSGLNKPKQRYRDSRVPNIGKDGNGRALYRDIFLDLTNNNTYAKLKKLIIHELAHSMANHIQWRPDDHGQDFKFCENLIKQYWPKQ